MYISKSKLVYNDIKKEHMSRDDIFKNTKCLAGISNLFGMSEAIKRQFGNGFPGLNSPRGSYLYRCDDCTQKRLEK